MGSRTRRVASRALGGAHEEDLGQVDGHVQVVVQEAGVLLGVQQLQQRARRVARVPCARRAAGFDGRAAQASRLSASHNASIPHRLLTFPSLLSSCLPLYCAWQCRPAGCGPHAPPNTALGTPNLVTVTCRGAPRPSLSISSMRTKGLLVPVNFRHCTILPGMAPTYVRRCPVRKCPLSLATRHARTIRKPTLRIICRQRRLRWSVKLPEREPLCQVH